MGKISALLYGIVSYLLFFATFLYLFGFAGDVFVPKSVSAGGAAAGSASSAVLINLGLIALFGVQHSVMARPGFKAWWTRFVPQPVERSTFVLITNAVFILMFWAWRPLPAVLWDVSGTLLGPALWAVFALGLLVVLGSSFMISHFDLFGLRQTFLHFQGKPYTPMPFKVTGFYKWVRNPLMLGFLMAFWAAPVMTAGRLLFAAGMTLYIFLGIYFEERTIAKHLGEPYLKYRGQTSMILPFFKLKASGSAPSAK
jgi:protein-S-isoprenylcysteine O-methyltransferase Ste14